MAFVVGRFAPSPSGRMHLGNVLCALLAWLSARTQGGQYLVRIEDLDTLRCPRSYASLILEDLHWLGLDWDGVVLYQSERTSIYESYAAILREKGLLYPCFCSRAELHAASAPHLSDGRIVYGGQCRTLTAAQIAQKQRTRKPATRIRVPDEVISLTDLVQGRYSERLSPECGDFILQRSDGVFAYQFAVVIDDALSGVTEVVRGRDLLSSTPRQIWLHRLLGFSPPAFAHIPLLCAADGRRLSKRERDLDLGLLRTRLSPAALVGWLACAAGLRDTPAPVTPHALLGDFDWGRVPKDTVFLPPLS